MPKILVSFGTRPEAIKLAPVIHALRARPELDVVVVNVGQHGEMLDETIASFGITPDRTLAIGRPGQSLADLSARALTDFAGVLRDERPDMVVVQGDTTTMFASTLTAFYDHIPVAHVEAGLRTGRNDLPFPEELNRRLTGAVAALHFPPTERARDNLLREGIDPATVLVTGNTVIDALEWMLANSEPPSELKPVLDDPRRIVAVTAHRRESWGVPMEAIGSAIGELARDDGGVLFVFPIHPNPVVRDAIAAGAGGLDNVSIVEPLPYAAFVHLMAAATVLLTDSGGIQEEAAALGKPVVVMRDVTERGEGVDAGTAELVGRDPRAIVAAVRRLLDDEEHYRARVSAPNPYGDGHAAERIADRIVAFFS